MLIQKYKKNSVWTHINILLQQFMWLNFLRCQWPQTLTRFFFLSRNSTLIGAPLNALPEKDLPHLALNRLSRWQLIKTFSNMCINFC